MNEQRIEKQHLRERRVEVHSIFPTIQGEGPYAGHPAVFVRLTGCNLQCPMCDTEYTSTRELLDPDEIVPRIAAVASPNRLVVITGGEPFRQNITPLCRQLVRGGYLVQVETNGTLFVDGLPESVQVVCSPKAGALNSRMAQRVDAFKYVLHADSIDPDDGLPLSVLGRNVTRVARPPERYLGPVYVQPVDVDNAAENARHLDAAIASARRHGHILCLQIHKILNLA